AAVVTLVGGSGRAQRVGHGHHLLLPENRVRVRARDTEQAVDAFSGRRLHRRDQRRTLSTGERRGAAPRHHTVHPRHRRARVRVHRRRVVVGPTQLRLVRLHRRTQPRRQRRPALGGAWKQTLPSGRGSKLLTPLGQLGAFVSRECGHRLLGGGSGRDKDGGKQLHGGPGSRKQIQKW
ncbi:hypothetical protein H310_11746, partial [Aphanomyces invadans]